MSYRNCELAKGTAEKFKAFLKRNNIKYEASEAGHLIHFECLMDDAQMELANRFLDEEEL